MKLSKKSKSQPKGHKMMGGGGSGHQARKVSEGGRDKPAGSHAGKGFAHQMKGGGDANSGHGKTIRQTANAKNEHLAMLTGSGHYGRNHVGPVKSGTFMQQMVAKRGY